MSGAFEVVREGPVLRVWLNRPERRNALDTTALETIATFFASLARDFQARVVILGGRGASFCAGADLRDPPGRETLRGDSGATDRQRRHASQIGLRARRSCSATASTQRRRSARVPSTASWPSPNSMRR
jgi:enoyl-CoA hydratase/carnithine racemase